MGCPFIKHQLYSRLWLNAYCLFSYLIPKQPDEIHIDSPLYRQGNGDLDKLINLLKVIGLRRNKATKLANCRVHALPG